MEEEEIEKAVIAYLKKKGFKQTEFAFQEEQNLIIVNDNNNKNSSSNSSSISQTDPDIAKQILSFSEPEDIPARYEDEYSKLRLWTYSSLDLYKVPFHFGKFSQTFVKDIGACRGTSIAILLVVDKHRCMLTIFAFVVDFLNAKYNVAFGCAE